ncbi:MAG TPA: hypothetical protein VGK73_14290, partial [Polyangiaceae bacterium]
VVMTPAPMVAAPPGRELARLGPLTVTRASMSPLRAIVAVIVLINAVLLGAVLLLFARLRRTEQALAESRQESPPEPQLRRKDRELDAGALQRR